MRPVDKLRKVTYTGFRHILSYVACCNAVAVPAHYHRK
jgi:hypothetical protein